MVRVVTHSQPNQKPLSARLEGRKGAFQAAFAGNADPRSAGRATPLPQLHNPAKPERLAERAIGR